ncbi:hypothetical protein KOW79_001106 [Hemibagrus wyckioides]|uniref:Uncharacterized protein n=1 Tax=Hemibagrus wyckioides TaxID=337641 RepID=A0A9D3P837_9TELE|nr:hypothetical protein KOW79_001106 [Hemibagrus wyckioides]
MSVKKKSQDEKRRYKSPASRLVHHVSVVVWLPWPGRINVTFDAALPLVSPFRCITQVNNGKINGDTPS